MDKKSSLITLKESRLKQNKQKNSVENNHAELTKQTTIVLEANLFYAAKEVALKRKRAGIEPNTITGMVRKALKEIVEKEL